MRLECHAWKKNLLCLPCSYCDICLAVVHMLAVKQDLEASIPTKRHNIITHEWTSFCQHRSFPQLEKVSGTTETWAVVRNMFANTQVYKHKISKGYKKGWQNWHPLQSVTSYLTSDVCTSTHFTLDGRQVFFFFANISSLFFCKYTFSWGVKGLWNATCYRYVSITLFILRTISTWSVFYNGLAKCLLFPLIYCF